MIIIENQYEVLWKVTQGIHQQSQQGFDVGLFRGL